jgi:hypothetical protein
MLLRPGKFFPVFFLSLIYADLSGQMHWPETASDAMGGSFVCLSGAACSGQNQAGLGFTEKSSLSIQHGQPFLLKELGVSSVSGQFRTEKGALGVLLSTTGLKGLRLSSLWLACGQRLNPHISGGAGLHFWSFSLREQPFYAPGISFALGIQINVGHHWKIGARLFHPAAWSQHTTGPVDESMRIETGFAYTVFNVGRLYADLHIRHGTPITLCCGAQWNLNRQIILRTGVRSGPFTFSWGISFRIRKCLAEFSFRYRGDTGLSPSSALTYEW